MVTDENTVPAMIAAHNERLYYEGDETFDGKSQLVGTILIGNVPIPMVSVEGQHFPSLYPYVDFENKVFLYNERSDRYDRAPSLHGETEAVEIWHGVINPGLGVDSMDGYYEKLEKFFDKTHDFYQKKNMFEVTEEDEPPRVFYYDGFAEERAVTLRNAFQYGLWIRNLENLAYQRFSKYLLEDINEELKKFDNKNNKSFHELIDSLKLPGIDAEMITGGAAFSGEWIRQTPDIHTAPAILKMVKTFDQIVNKKILGEELAEIRNAGRYNSAERVRADLVPVRAAITDEIARSIIQKANDALEESFEGFLKDESLARKIPILDSASAHYGNSTSVPYKNYFFGREGKNIQNSSQCTIARGQPGDIQEFGRSILVEANNAFDVKSAERDMRVLEADSPYCFQDGGPHIQTFWGGNTMIRMAHMSHIP